MELKIAAVTAAWITLSTIEPDWSTATTTCQRSVCSRTRVLNSGSRITSRRVRGSTCLRLARTVPGASKFAATCCRERRRGSRRPVNGWVTGRASARISSRTTLSTMVRAIASTSGFIRCLVDRIALSRLVDGVAWARVSALVTTSVMPCRLIASSMILSATERGNSACTWLTHSGTVIAPVPSGEPSWFSRKSRAASIAASRAGRPPSCSWASEPSVRRQRCRRRTSSSRLTGHPRSRSRRRPTAATRGGPAPPWSLRPPGAAARPGARRSGAPAARPARGR